MMRDDMLPGRLELQALHRVERRQVVEEDLVRGRLPGGSKLTASTLIRAK
jgi:hypothetical protein